MIFYSKIIQIAITIFLFAGCIFCLYLLIDWSCHLTMNKGGKWTSFTFIKKQIKQCPYKWVREKTWENKSAFIQTSKEISYDEYRKWYLHASIIKLNGIRYKLNPISWLKYKRFIRNWNLPYEGIGERQYNIFP